MTIAELFARIGVKADTAKVQGFQKAMSTAKTTIVTTTGDVVRFVGEIQKLTKEVFNSAAALKQFESETGASAQELQKWQAVAEQTNNSAESVSSAIKSIVSNQEKIRLGQGNISGFQLLGIDPRQDPFKILDTLREKTVGLSQGMKKNVLAQMGIGSELIQVLELSNDKFKELSENAFVIPPAAITMMDKARGSMAGVSRAVKFLKSIIAAELSPGIQEMNKNIVEWIKNNKDGIIRTVKLAFEWVRKFTGAIFNAGRMLNTVVENTIGWKNAITGLLAILAILNAGIIASPIGLLIAGLLLLVAVLDDLYVYSQGKGKSLFGVLMKQFPEFEKNMLGFLNKLKSSIALVKALFKGDEIGITALVEELGGLGVGIVALFELIKTTFDLAFTNIKQFFAPIKFLVDVLDELYSAFKGEKGYGEAFKEVGRLFKDELVGGTKERYQEFLGRAKESVKTINNAFNVNMEINTTADAEETAELVNSKLQGEIVAAEAQRSKNE